MSKNFDPLQFRLLKQYLNAAHQGKWLLKSGLGDSIWAFLKPTSEKIGILEGNVSYYFFSSNCNGAQPKNVHLCQVKGMKFHSHTFCNANVGKALSLGKKKKKELVLKFPSVEKSSKLNLFHKILPSKISQNILWWEKREIYSDSHNSKENNVPSLIHTYHYSWQRKGRIYM